MARPPRTLARGEPLCSESGLDIGAFLARLHDGSAAKTFDGDRALMSSLGVHSFPTFLVKFNDARYMLRGFNGYETFVAVIDSATQGALKPVTVEATGETLLALMAEHPRMATEEVRQAFGLASLDETQRFVAPLLEDGKLAVQRAGNGWFIKLPDQKMVCDVTTDICA